MGTNRVIGGSGRGSDMNIQGLLNGRVIWMQGINGTKTTFTKYPFGCLRIWDEVAL